MPIRRPNNNDPDWMAKKQDKELIYLEERISALYEEASHDVTEEYERFFTDYQLEYNNRLAMVESGEMTEDAFQNWCRHRIFQDNRYQAMIRMLTDVLVNADVAAMAAVNEQLPYTLAESYDFISSLGFEAADQAGISMGTFQIYNADSVQAIIRDNPDLLPVVNLPEDELWNRNHINNEITQAIIRGDSMQQVARRLQNVAQMDNNAAIRNARTSMTAAENLGRSESARRLKEKGLPVKEVWSATHDSRTRDTHLLLDGTEKNEDGYYGVGILGVPLRFPADPRGEGREIYNCRCRENVPIAGIDHSRDGELYEQFMQNNYPEDWEKIQQRRADPKTGEYRRNQERISALERQARLREERGIQPKPSESYSPREIVNRYRQNLSNSNIYGTLSNNSEQEVRVMESWREEKPIYQRMTEGGIYLFHKTGREGKFASNIFETIHVKTYDRLPKYMQRSVVGLNANNTADGIHYHIWFVNKDGEIDDIDEYGWEDFIYWIRENKGSIGNLNDFEYDEQAGFRLGDILRRRRR